MATAGLSDVPGYLAVNWILSQFGIKKATAQKRYRAFVMDGIESESPWRELQGQILLGEEGFVEKLKDLLADKEPIKEIPRQQRYANRPSLADIFEKGKIKDKKRRNLDIHTAHVKFGYTLKEIADHLKVHYTTVSKALKDGANGK